MASQLAYLTVESQLVEATHPAPEPSGTHPVKKPGQFVVVSGAKSHDLAAQFVPVFHVQLPSDPTLD